MAQLVFKGPDAQGFLQGQLSSDIAALDVGGNAIAGFHSPQGRVIALLQLQRASREEIHALLPLELADVVITRLRRFVLRSKLQISQSPACAPPAGVMTRAARIAVGLPQVYAATTELFVAQMLNLDVIGAISFTKGCYTGQEVIARAHYRGRIKRRMQRFLSAAPCALTAGENHRLQDGRNAQIVDAVQRADGRVEFLAVTTFSAAVPVNADVIDAGATEAPTMAASAQLLACTALELPYALPD